MFFAWAVQSGIVRSWRDWRDRAKSSERVRRLRNRPGQLAETPLLEASLAERLTKEAAAWPEGPADDGTGEVLLHYVELRRGLPPGQVPEAVKAILPILRRNHADAIRRRGTLASARAGGRATKGLRRKAADVSDQKLRSEARA